MLKDNKSSKRDTKYNIELFHDGKNFVSYKFMGSHLKSENKKRGVKFTTWAPKAEEVYVVGDFSEI